MTPNEYHKSSESGGCLAKDVHDEMREDEVDIGGEEKTTKELMRPQTGENLDA